MPAPVPKDEGLREEVIHLKAVVMVLIDVIRERLPVLPLHEAEHRSHDLKVLHDSLATGLAVDEELTEIKEFLRGQ